MHQHNEYTRSSLDIFRLVYSPYYYLETPASRYETAFWACRGLTVPKDLDFPPSRLPWLHLSSNRPSPSSVFMLPTSLNCADIVHDRNCSPDHRRTIMTCLRSVLPATADVDAIHAAHTMRRWSDSSYSPPARCGPGPSRSLIAFNLRSSVISGLYSGLR